MFSTHRISRTADALEDQSLANGNAPIDILTLNSTTLERRWSFSDCLRFALWCVLREVPVDIAADYLFAFDRPARCTDTLSKRADRTLCLHVHHDYLPILV